MKTLKFGGTSMANAASIACVKDIILADKSAKFVVVSAPGKRNAGDIKVTDLLVKCHAATDGNEKRKLFRQVRERFISIIDGLDIDIDLTPDFDIAEKAIITAGYDYTVSRGEYFAAKLLACYIGYDFIDGTELVRFNGRSFDPDLTDRISCERLSRCAKGVVIPGFYGADESGGIVAFSRGGSDISGAIIARATGAEVYENWTDVDGFMVCDPRIVDHPRIIDMLTYKELRELSYMGASVLHPESVFPVRKGNIPINIRNTFSPSAPGTFIVPTKHYKEGKFIRPGRVVTGIAGKKDFIGIFIERQMMNGEIGFIKALMDILCEFDISLEHMPTGIDTLTLVIDSDGVTDEVMERVVARITECCRPDAIDVTRGLALIAVVGHGMLSSKGTAFRVCGALTKAGINIRMIDQGSSELNIIIGVENGDYENAVKALYSEFEV